MARKPTVTGRPSFGPAPIPQRRSSSGGQTSLPGPYDVFPVAPPRPTRSPGTGRGLDAVGPRNVCTYPDDGVFDVIGGRPRSVATRDQRVEALWDQPQATARPSDRSLSETSGVRSPGPLGRGDGGGGGSA